MSALDLLLLAGALAAAYGLAGLLALVSRVPSWDETATYERLIRALGKGQTPHDLPQTVIDEHKGGAHHE